MKFVVLALDYDGTIAERDVLHPEVRTAIDERPTGQSARTLRDLATLVREIAPDVLTGHLQRADFSRWVREVFGDQELAADLHILERLERNEALSDLRTAIVRLITERYSLTDEPT